MPKYKSSAIKNIVANVWPKELPEIWHFFKQSLLKHKASLLILVAWSLAGAGLQSYLGAHLFASQEQQVSLVLAIFLASALTRTAMSWYQEKIANKVYACEKIKLFNKIPQFFSTRPKISKDEILYIANSDFSNLAHSLGSTAIALLSNIVAFTAVLGFVALKFPQQLLPLLVVGIILFSLSLFIRVVIKKNFTKSRNEDAKLFKIEKSLIEGYEHHFVNNNIASITKNYRKIFHNWQQAENKTALAYSFGDTLMWSAKFLFVLVLLLPTGALKLNIDTVYWAFVLLGSSSQMLNSLQRMGVVQMYWQKSRDIWHTRGYADRRININKVQIKVEDLAIAFGRQIDQFDLKSINFNLVPGQALLLKGPSGAGKTTVLRTLLGLHRNFKGHIYCNKNLLYAFVSQDPYFAEGQSLAKNLGVDQLSHIPQDWLQKLNLNDFFALTNGDLQNSYWGSSHLKPSKGQRQRLAILRELLREPDVLLLDEPLSSLDFTSAAKAMALIKEQGQNKILIIAEHNPLAEKIIEPKYTIDLGNSLYLPLKSTATGPSRHV